MSGGVKTPLADQLKNHRRLNQTQKHDCGHIRRHRGADASLTLATADYSGNFAQVAVKGLLNQPSPARVSSKDLLRKEYPG